MTIIKVSCYCLCKYIKKILKTVTYNTACDRNFDDSFAQQQQASNCFFLTYEIIYNIPIYISSVVFVFVSLYIKICNSYWMPKPVVQPDDWPADHFTNLRNTAQAQSWMGKIIRGLSSTDSTAQSQSVDESIHMLRFMRCCPSIQKVKVIYV